jgi:Fe-S-cluster containining protein
MKEEKTSEILEDCASYNCGNCCDPVKTRRFFPDDKIPRKSDGSALWKKKDGLFLTAGGIALDIFDCDNYDPETKRCKDYENRPQICKNSGCDNDPESLSKNKFIRIGHNSNE